MKPVGILSCSSKIVINTKDYYKAKDICYLNFPDSIIAPFTGSDEISPLQYFGRMFLAGAVIEVAADETWDLESRRPERN